MEFLKDILIEILWREACRMGTPPHRRPCPYDLRGRPGTDTADRVQQKCPGLSVYRGNPPHPGNIGARRGIHHNFGYTQGNPSCRSIPLIFGTVWRILSQGGRISARFCVLGPVRRDRESRTRHHFGKD